jgi:hypothetical protein
MTKDKALKMAIEALKNGTKVHSSAILAIEEALAQQEQEPVAWHYPGGSPEQCTTDKAYAQMEPAWTPMYHKREWVGLTEEEVERIVKQCDDTKDSRAWYKRLTNAVERALKEKNT